MIYDYTNNFNIIYLYYRNKKKICKPYVQVQYRLEKKSNKIYNLYICILYFT